MVIYSKLPLQTNVLTSVETLIFLILTLLLCFSPCVCLSVCLCVCVYVCTYGQLVLTVGLLAVVVYLYTVVAFNFFRKFYNKSEDGESPDMKCDDMLTVSSFCMCVIVCVKQT